MSRDKSPRPNILTLHIRKENKTMTNKNFKDYVVTVKKAFEGCLSVKGCDEFLALYKDRESETNLTEKQLEAVYAIGQARKDEIIAHNTAVEMAKTQKGGKQTMETKKNTAAQTAPAEPVEVLKGEVIDTKTEKQVTAAIERISAKVEKIGKGYLDIVGDVARLRALKAWKITGHKSMYDLCADKFGMSRATVGNLEAIFARYGNKETFKLTDEAEGLSVRQMLANIKSEKTAELEDKNGESAEGDGNGAGAGKGEKKGKIETLTSISFEISAEWSIDEMLEELKAQLTEQGAVYPDGATLTLTITK